MRSLSPLLLCNPGVSGTMHPGFRNEFHASLQQALGKYAVFSGEYIWKYTHNAFDFSVLGNTPITFPIDWHNSKIPGYALHVEVPNYHGFSGLYSHVLGGRALLPAAVAGAGATRATQGTLYPSASITTRSSTRPRTFSTRSPTMAVGSMACGAASTGAMTRASSPARCLAIT